MRKTDDQKPQVFLDLMNDYTKQLTSVEGKSPHTVKSYKDCYAVFFDYTTDVLNAPYDTVHFSMLSYDVLLGFLDWLETNRKCSVRTRNQRRAALCSFGKYAARTNFKAAGGFYSEVCKIPKKRGESRKISFFSIEELKIILSYPNLHTLVGRRDSILLVMMYFLGTRAQEICDLKVRDIEFLKEGTARVTIHGKGNKTRILPLSATVTKKLKEYIRYEGISRTIDAYVFRTQTHPQMSDSCVEEVFKKYVLQAKKEHPDMFKEKTYTPHSMRHTTAVHMLEAGIPLVKIQRFLGHSTIASTQIYAEITQASLDKAVADWYSKTWGYIKNTSYDKDEDCDLTKSRKHANTRRPDFLQ